MVGRTLREQMHIDHALYAATTALEYASVLPLLTPRELVTELQDVAASLDLYRGVIERNEANGFGLSENVQKQRQIKSTLETKVRLLREQLRQRS